MSEFLSANLALIERRWPVLAGMLATQDVGNLPAELRQGRESTLAIQGVQLGSRHDRSGEARQQAASLPVESPVVHLYGSGLGDLAREFLRRQESQRLEVHILNEAVFALILHLLDQTDWLGDPRIELGLAGDAAEIQLPFFALPPELVLASERNARIRDRLVAEIGVPFANARFDPDDPERLARLAANRALLAGDRDVAELFCSRPGCEAWILATGPTLSGHYERLRAAASLPLPRRPLLVAVDTALRPLLDHGVRPDLVVSIDLLSTSRTLDPERSAGLPLVYFPLLPPEVLTAWRGPRFGAYSQSLVYERLRRELPRGILHADGSVLHPAVDLAVRMGARQLVLFGADFAYVGGSAHAGWQRGELAPTLVSEHWVLNGRGERVQTLLNLRAYLCGLERYIAAHPEVRFLNASRAGAWIAGTAYHPEFAA